MNSELEKLLRLEKEAEEAANRHQRDVGVTQALDKRLKEEYGVKEGLSGAAKELAELGTKVKRLAAQYEQELTCAETAFKEWRQKVADATSTGESVTGGKGVSP
jgi:hypothetical protein